MPVQHLAYSSDYERMTGNCTRHIASQMVSTVSPSINSTSYILDNACGPGIVSEQIKFHYPEAKIMATDLNEGMLGEMKARIQKEGWKNVETGIEDVRRLEGMGDGVFTHVFTNLGMPVPGDEGSGEEITGALFRVLKVGGVVMVSTWADRVWLIAFYNAAKAIRPNEEPSYMMALNPEVLRGSWLARQLEDGGFGNNVEVRPCVTYTEARSLDELVENMMLAKNMFFGGFNEDELARAKPVLKKEFVALRTFEEVDGGVRIGMKAWIGIGWKKGDEGEVAV